MRDNHFDPATELTIVGLDTPDGPGTPGYDEASNAEPDDSPGMQRLVQALVRRAPFSAVTVTTIGRTRIVNCGRRRTRALRMANKIRIANGLEPFKMPVVPQQFDGAVRDMELEIMSIAENYVRTPARGITACVRDAVRLLNRGCEISEIANALNVTPNGARRYIKISQLAPAVQKAIEKDRVSADAALLWHGLSEAEQLAQLEKVLAGEPSAEKLEKTEKTPAVSSEQPSSRDKLIAKKRNAKSRKDAPKRVTKRDVQKSLGETVKRSAKTVRKVMALPTCAFSERDKLVARWAIGDGVTDDEVGLFVKK
jgi:predicted transcriptional regulator